MEEWRDVVGFERQYEVSSIGRVRHKIEKFLLMKDMNHKSGYTRVKLNDYGHRTTHLVHRLVAVAFLENPLHKKEVNHKDFDKHNNKVENLEWCTMRENLEHAYKAGKLSLSKKFTAGASRYPLRSQGDR